MHAHVHVHVCTSHFIIITASHAASERAFIVHRTANHSLADPRLTPCSQSVGPSFVCARVRPAAGQ
eukprot:scaffold4201_cov119-Isochrysis_galbana.AAC.8